MKVVIVGSGVSGGLVATALKDMPGVELFCLEKVGPDSHANAGNGLNVGPNALKALQRALPEKADTLVRISLPWTRWKASLATGEFLYEVPLDTVADRPGIRIRWSDLYQCVRSSVTSHTEYWVQISSIERQEPDESFSKFTITYTSENSSIQKKVTDIDWVIAADGRYSQVRELCCQSPIVQPIGVANYRCLIDDDGGDSGVEDMEQWFCGNHRIIAFRVSDGRIYVSGNVPIHEGELVSDALKEKDEIFRRFTPEQGVMDARYAYVLEKSCQPEAIHHWARFQQIDDCFHDETGRVLLLGDASHAMAPTLGQGATQAIEDASLFVLLFKRYWAEGFPENPLEFAQAFAELRRERIAFVKAFSYQASDSLFAGIDPVATSREKAGPAYRAKFVQLYQDIPGL